MPFDNIRFPVAISRRASGGPERRTDVVLTASGREERNARWATSRRKYNAGYGVKSLDDIQNVIGFFEERRGRLYAFRFKDHTDFKSSAPSAAITPNDQLLGTGDGTTKTFQLTKRYGSGIRNYFRTVLAPVAGTVVAAVNGVQTSAFTTDIATGLITFTVAPALSASITAGFEFDVPVRFDTDAITINLTHFAAGEIPDIPLIEVKA